MKSLIREGHKIFRNLHLTFDWHYIGQKFRWRFREYVRNLDLRVQVHPGELWVSKQRVHIVLQASKSAGAKGDVPKICGFVNLFVLLFFALRLCCFFFFKIIFFHSLLVIPSPKHGRYTSLYIVDGEYNKRWNDHGPKSSWFLEPKLKQSAASIPATLTSLITERTSCVAFPRDSEKFFLINKSNQSVLY